MSKTTQHILDPDLVSLNREDTSWQEKLLKLFEQGKREELQKYLEDLYPSDVAFLLERLNFNDGLGLFDGLKPESRGEVLAELHEDSRLLYLEALSSQSVAAILELQPSDRAAHLIEKLEKQQINEIIHFLPELQRVRIIELLGYPENTAGAIMTKEYVSVQIDDTVKKAIFALRASQQKENIHTIFVIDKSGHYQGHISLPKLVLANPQTKVKRVMAQELMPIPVDKDQEEVAKFFTRYDLITAPIISSSGLLLGRITADDVLDIVQKEASEDILRMGGISKEETSHAPFFRSSLRRSVWLILNLATAFISAAVIRSFDEAIETAVIIASFMPIVASIGGSAGGQTMTLTIRHIVLGELSLDTISKRLIRELLISFVNGLGLGGLTGLVVYMLTQNMPLAIVIFLALLTNILVAAFCGALVPQLLHRFKIDPAIGSVILVTTCTDIMGFFLFLSLATLGLEFIAKP